MRKKLEAGEITYWKKSAQTESKRQKKKERIQQAFSNAVSVEVIPATESNLTDDKPYCALPPTAMSAPMKRLKPGALNYRCSIIRL